MIVLAGLYWHFEDIEKVSYLAIASSVFVLLFGVLFFHTYKFYLGLIFLIPFSLDTNLLGGAQVTLPSEGMLLMLLPVLFLFHADFSKSIKRVATHPIAIFLFIDLLLQIITTLTSGYMDVSVKRVVIRVLFITGFFLTVNTLENKKNLIQVWTSYAFGLLPVMLLVLRNHMNFEFNPRTVFAVCKPYYNDHTLYGACLAFVIPLLVLLFVHRKRLGWKSWQIWVLGFTTILVIISEALALSRAAILSVVVAIVFALLLRVKMNFAVMLSGLFILAMTAVTLRGPIYEYLEQNEAVSNDGEIGNHLSSVTNIQTDASNLERVNRWICAIRMFEEKPLVGFGPGTYQFEYNKFQTIEHKTYISTNTGDKGNAHSEFLTYLSENGIFGIIIFLFTVFGAVYFGMQNHEQLKDPLLRVINLGVLLGLITYFFHGIFNAFMDQSKMAFLYFTALGTIVWINQRLKSEEIH